MSLTVAICEDEHTIREELKGLILSRNKDYSLDSYHSADDLLASGKDYDLYILDIQMPGMNGMELAQTIRAKEDYPGPVIIFVTALIEHMQGAFDVQAYHFLTKPIDNRKFHAVLDSAVAESLRRNKREHIVVKASGIAHTVLLNEIMFVESIGKKVAIHTCKEILESYGKIGEIAAALSQSPLFFRCHRCYIVNMEYITKFSAMAISLKNGQEVFLARDKHQDFIKAYARYAMK